MGEKRICIFGDSIAWGEGDAINQGWARLLRKYVESEEIRKEVYVELHNCAIPGDRTTKLLKRFENEAEAREPTTIIFAIGINDSVYIESKENPRTKIESFKENIKNLIEQAKDLADRVVVIGLTDVDESLVMPIPWATTKYYDQENIEKYDACVELVSAESQAEYISMRGVLSNADLSDGVHPNTEGHQKMFEKIKEYFTVDVI